MRLTAAFLFLVLAGPTRAAQTCASAAEIPGLSFSIKDYRQGISDQLAALEGEADLARLEAAALAAPSADPALSAQTAAAQTLLALMATPDYFRPGHGAERQMIKE